MIKCSKGNVEIKGNLILLEAETVMILNITLGINNLKYDCHICHQKEGAKDGEAERLIRYEFDKDGDLRELPPP